MKPASAPKPGCDCAVCHALRANHAAGCRKYIECRRDDDLAQNYARYRNGELLKDVLASLPMGD